ISHMRMTRLATRCNSSLARLTHVARKLKRRGLPTRRMSERDKPDTVGQITPTGRKLITNLRDVSHRAVEVRITESLSGEGLRQAIVLKDHMLRRNVPDHLLFSA